MKKFLTKIIIFLIRTIEYGGTSLPFNASKWRVATFAKKLRVTLKGLLKDFVLITVGIFSAAFGLHSFLLPNAFIDGGVTGISLLVSELTNWSLSLLIFVINVPFVLMGTRVISKSFAIKATLAIIGLSLCLYYVHFPLVTSDKLLVALFGGFFLGAGIGLSIRGGAVLDGTEVLAILLSKKLGVTVGDVILIINIMIFSAAAYLLSIETAMYSMVTYVAASKTLDFFIEGIEEYIGVTIISSHSEEVRKMIIEYMGRGVTTYNGKRGFGNHGERKDIDIIYTVITRLEINKLNTEIEKIDPTAFVVVSSVKDTKGGMIKKRPLKG